jgi:hypothetical protein
MSRPCPHCQRPYAPGRRFCGACRAVLAAICTTCGFTNDHDDSWCGGCARSLRAEQRWIPPQPSAPSAPVASSPEPTASASRSIRLPEPRQTTRAIAIAPMPAAKPIPPPAPRPRAADIEVEIEPAQPKPRTTVSDSIDRMLATARGRSPGT